ncbi:MAG: pantoate--beta-alanine ligase [Akkermansiaceae bacterium]|jgi:pantoate--beta-alanine ligase|nr:pantoate--beta-alanine ligase [Akkermansiaceae bacterium]MDP4647863.1 pantoate--beta-alanine ligase [Akkermansiaceae bacterium]MDP4722031.1 pantoate--beta-alanine ligase [Akkermansiaceae bacterium]MDP4780520.1 pantoate--beta-alanine ligase [Akkermansiaceae bacterium]MDP4846120.1 pantoate--beta-alanine ligase [Akkermansiaceae bacterium]
MWTATTKQDLRSKLPGLPRPVILVPTMGALHPGHASLIELARKRAGENGTVIVSIFVNPIQFDRPSDLEKYPRCLDADLTVCRKNGADGVFIPEDGEMYFTDRSVTVIESSLSKHLCGATRPGHFDGVCTVVLKLFNLTRCDAAVFGEKDFQQLAIIRRMLRDLDLGTEIIPHPTVRENDGLAMSSRNGRLTPEQRVSAPRIRQALTIAAEKSSVDDILSTARNFIEESPFAKIDYLSLVDAETLAPADDLSSKRVLACAVFYGEVRLIDHITIKPRA